MEVCKKAATCAFDRVWALFQSISVVDRKINQKKLKVGP